MAVGSTVPDGGCREKAENTEEARRETGAGALSRPGRGRAESHAGPRLQPMRKAKGGAAPSRGQSGCSSGKQKPVSAAVGKGAERMKPAGGRSPGAVKKWN